MGHDMENASKNDNNNLSEKEHIFGPIHVTETLSSLDQLVLENIALGFRDYFTIYIHDVVRFRYH